MNDTGGIDPNGGMATPVKIQKYPYLKAIISSRGGMEIPLQRLHNIVGLEYDRHWWKKSTMKTCLYALQTGVKSHYEIVRVGTAYIGVGNNIHVLPIDFIYLSDRGYIYLNGVGGWNIGGRPSWYWGRHPRWREKLRTIPDIDPHGSTKIVSADTVSVTRAILRMCDYVSSKTPNKKLLLK